MYQLFNERKIQWQIVNSIGFTGVSDKTGIGKFAQGLIKRGVKLLSTGGTAKLLLEMVCRNECLIEMMDGQ